MTINILMPALSPTMTEGNIARWHKKEGDTVQAGDILAEIETDKATMEVEAADEGILGKILVPDGSEGVQVNSVIGVILEEGEAATAPAASVPKPLPDPMTIEEGPQPEVKEGVPALVRPSVKPSQKNEVEYSGQTISMTVREALREAMAEEMRADSSVFLMGEEVAEYEGAYKVSQG